MTRALLTAAVLAAGCGKPKTEVVATPGYVVTFALDENLDRDAIDGFSATITREGGFPKFDSVNVDGIAVASTGVVTLTWPADFDYAKTPVQVRLVFNNSEALPLTIAAVATDGKGLTLAQGSKDVTVPAGGDGETEVPVSCVNADCTGDDKGEADMGPPSQDMTVEPTDAGVDMGPDEGVVIEGLAVTGEMVTGAGTSESDDGTLKLRQEVGHTVGRGKASSASYEVETVLMMTR
ncbi:MAG: hypothetical protein AABZ30_04150 [Myxococcota bacterium]